MGIRNIILSSVLILALAGCDLPLAPNMSAEAENPNIVVPYKISKRAAKRLPEKHLDEVNELRTAQGLSPLVLSPELTAAAQAHAVDMVAQQRAWHFGRDGSSPLDRIPRFGYTGLPIGENISETHEDHEVTLAAWMRGDNTRSIIMDPEATSIGFAWVQEPNLKIWWVQVIGG